MKDKIVDIIKKILSELEYPIINPEIQKPKKNIKADFATNIAFKLSSSLKDNPLNIASSIKDKMIKSNQFSTVEVAKPGFINFSFKSDIILQELNNIIKKDVEFGKNNIGKNKKVLVEFVSANPTGPLTVGHGRGAIIGDVISNIYTWNGYNVDREYYYNNAGRQMRKLGESTLARYLELCKAEHVFPKDGYKGEYIKEIAKKIKIEYKESLKNDKNIDFFKAETEKYIFKEIESTLSNIGIKFNSFFNENSLYENNKISEIIDKLKKINLIYKKDGATWFEGTKVGRPADRVLIKSSGEPTYRLPDIAYHTTKFDRGYEICIDVFGADHMDAYPDVLSAIKQLNYKENNVKVLIHQFISILKDGKPIKMSTRAANFITLDELTKEVGKDVLRYFFIMRGMNSHLNFDLKIAKEKSENNPVYYIQYANARISNIIDKTSDININNNPNLKNLSLDIELGIINQLIEFEELIIKLIDLNEPQILANYLFDLASLFHKYYAKNRIITDNLELSSARIVFIKAIQIVLKNGLDILGISHPDRM